MNEQAVIGTILAYSRDNIHPIETCLEAGVTANWFGEHDTRIIWDAMESMYADGKAIDMLTVGERLKTEGKLCIIHDGYTTLEEMIDKVTVLAYLPSYIEALENDYRVRQVFELVLEVGADADREDANGANLITDLQDKALALGTDKKAELTFGEHASNLADKCEAGEVGHMPQIFDSYTDELGLLSNEIVIIHAPRSTGKTSYMKQWHLRLKRLGIDVPFFSLETPASRIVSRYMAEIGEVNMFKMSNPRLHPPPFHQDWKRLKTASDEIAKLDLTVFDGNWDIERIRTKAKQLVDRGAQGIMIDNLICIKTRKQFDSQQRKYMYLLDKFREIREDINKPIILLAHPNADGNVKWAGELEDLADVVLYLFDIEKEGQRRDVDLYARMGIERRDLPDLHQHIVAKVQKNRDGNTPRLEMDFDLEYQTFKAL